MARQEKTYEDIPLSEGKSAAHRPDWLLSLEQLARDGHSDVLDFAVMRKRFPIEPTDDCLQPHEVEQYVSEGVLAPYRRGHVASCKYCLNLLDGLKTQPLMSEWVKSTLSALLKNAAPRSPETLVASEAEFSAAAEEQRLAKLLGAVSLPPQLAAVLPLVTMKIVEVMRVRLQNANSASNPHLAAEALTALFSQLFRSTQEATKFQSVMCDSLGDILNATIRERPRLPAEEIDLLDGAFGYLEEQAPDLAENCRDRYQQVRSASRDLVTAE
jgi:hypothetical protein